MDGGIAPSPSHAIAFRTSWRCRNLCILSRRTGCDVMLASQTRGVSVVSNRSNRAYVVLTPCDGWRVAVGRRLVRLSRARDGDAGEHLRPGKTAMAMRRDYGVDLPSYSHTALPSHSHAAAALAERRLSSVPVADIASAQVEDPEACPLHA